MVISVDDYLLFCHRTLDAMAASVSRLDDSRVNRSPDLPGANSPYVIVTHALGACEWWTAHMVCGHHSNRDRDAEFIAVGSVADAVERINATKVRLSELREAMEAATGLVVEPMTQTPLGAEWTVGAALIHAYEELAQHLGHLEVTVDFLQ